MTLDQYLKIMPPGTATKLSKEIGIDRALLHRWKYGRYHVPTKHAEKILKATNGFVGIQDLYPDSWFIQFPDAEGAQEQIEKLGFTRHKVS